MKFDTDPSILAAVEAYQESSNTLTQTALDVEAACPHKFWCGDDDNTNNNNPGIYICLNCRMEIKVPYGQFTRCSLTPSDSLVLTLKQCGVANIHSLRIQGDQRKALITSSSMITQWPRRETQVEPD